METERETFNVGDKVTFKNFQGYCGWYNRTITTENHLRADDILEVTWVIPGKVGVVCHRAKVGCNIPTEFLKPLDTSDMDTQPITPIHHCPKCGDLMSSDDLGKTFLFQCPACEYEEYESKPAIILDEGR